MTQSIVEIAQDGRHISLFRGFLKISEGEKELARIPLESIHALLLNCHQATLTQNILLTCVQDGDSGETERLFRKEAERHSGMNPNTIRA
jgi:CRISPR-associated protein Cas1